MGVQWCVSPGYAYVHESVADAFVVASITALIKMYGADAAQSQNLSKIISEKDVDRIMNMTGTEKVAYGGRYDKTNRYIEPTIVYLAKWTDKIMEGEIFGPVLPVLRYSNLKDVVGIIKTKINQSNIQSWLETMPFGGVGTLKKLLQL